MNQPILDPQAVARLHRIGGDNLVRAMLSSFVENGALKVEAARAGAGAGIAAQVSDAAHALKSSAGNVGATTLQLVAQKVEREAVEAGTDLRALADELVAAFEDARAAVMRVADDAAGRS